MCNIYKVKELRLLSGVLDWMPSDLGKIDLFGCANGIGKCELASTVNTCDDVLLHASHSKQVSVNVASGVALKFVIGGGPKHNVGRCQFVGFYR